MAPINADPAIAADRAAIAISTRPSPKILPEEKPPPIFSKPPKRNDRSKIYKSRKKTDDGREGRARRGALSLCAPENLSGEPERRQIPYQLEHDENVRENYGARCFRKRAAEPRPPSWRAGARGRRGIEARQVFGKKYGGRRGFLKGRFSPQNPDIFQGAAGDPAGGKPHRKALPGAKAAARSPSFPKRKNCVQSPQKSGGQISKTPQIEGR